MSLDYSFVSKLADAGLVNRAKLIRLLESGAILKFRNFGEAKYIGLCKAFGVKPTLKATNPRSLKLAIGNHRRAIRELEKKLKDFSRS